jgi:hypothetical protein
MVADTNVSSFAAAGLDLDSEPPQLPHQLTSFHAAKVGQMCPGLNVSLLMRLS